MGDSDYPFDGFNFNALDSTAPGSALSGSPSIAGGSEISGGIGGIGWATIAIGVIIILVLIVIWRFSNFRENRVCLSTDLADYWPSGWYGIPRLPGQDYFPALGDFIPAETVVASRQPWMVNDNLLSSVAVGN